MQQEGGVVSSGAPIAVDDGLLEFVMVVRVFFDLVVHPVRRQIKTVRPDENPMLDPNLFYGMVVM